MNVSGENESAASTVCSSEVSKKSLVIKVRQQEAEDARKGLEKVEDEQQALRRLN